jgi:NDP-sugar pyrophosphorylase family protein
MRWKRRLWARGGAIRNAADLFPGEAVAVFNGDILTDFDLGAVIDFHREHRALSTLTLAEVPGPSPFGVLILNEEGRVVEWREPSEETKKALAADHDMLPTGKDLINSGFYILEPECIARIPQGVPSSVERDIFPKLLAERAAVYGFAPGGFWMDVGRAEQLMTATQAVLSGAVQTATPSLALGEGTRIAPSAWINGQCAIGRHCVIGNGSRLEGTILMDNVKVGNNVLLRGVIVDEGVTIEDEVVVEGRGGSSAVSVISALSVLGKGTRLHL